jgi:hypothetical protein
MTSLQGGIVPSPSGQNPRHLVMPPSVRKTANNSSSGAGIIRSFRTRPAFSLALPQNRGIFFCFLLLQGDFDDSGKADSCFDKSEKP